jgi:hypothetical protein
VTTGGSEPCDGSCPGNELGDCSGPEAHKKRINEKYIKGPFKADFLGGIVWAGPDNFHFADVRGWGQLSYEKDGDKIQDANLQFVVDALNEKVARDKK